MKTGDFWKRFVLAFLLSAVVAACGMGPYQGRETGVAPPGAASLEDFDNDIIVHDNNWWATSIEWKCNGSTIARTRGLVFNTATTLRLRLWPCQSVTFRVFGRGNRVYDSTPIQLGRGSRLRVNVGPTMNLTNWFVEHEA